MFKRIDDENDTKIEGFSYQSLDGDIESVRIGAEFCTVSRDEGVQYFEVFNEDIPKLILALQATYDYIKGRK